MNRKITLQVLFTSLSERVNGFETRLLKELV